MFSFTKTPVDDSVSIEVLSSKLNGYSGAEIVGVVRSAALAAMRQNKEIVSFCHFDTVLNTTRPMHNSQEAHEIFRRFQNLTLTLEEE